jgi:protein-arginine kinase activator protein McsA
MTPTSDERREVAARLRKCGAELSILGADCETAFHVIDKAIGCRELESWEGFLNRLADLIDPTCHMVDTDHEYEDSIRCDRCQMTFMRPWEPFKFCPNCGARCVDDAEVDE